MKKWSNSAAPPPYTPPEQRGEGWILINETHQEKRYTNPSDNRQIVIKSYYKDNNIAKPVTLELRYGVDNLLGWSNTAAEIHYDAEGTPLKKYWYRHGVYWPHLVRESGWQIKSLPNKDGGTGEFIHPDGRVMTLTSQNNVLPHPSPFSNCELAFFIRETNGALIAHREGDAPSFLIYERITTPEKNDWDSYWKPVWMEWKKKDVPTRKHGPYLIKMGFRQTHSLHYLPHLSQHLPIEIIKTNTGKTLGVRFPERAGYIKGIAYRESSYLPEALYFTPSLEHKLTSIHFLPNGTKQYNYTD